MSEKAGTDMMGSLEENEADGERKFKVWMESRRGFVESGDGSLRRGTTFDGGSRITLPGTGNVKGGLDQWAAGAGPLAAAGAHWRPLSNQLEVHWNRTGGQLTMAQVASLPAR